MENKSHSLLDKEQQNEFLDNFATMNVHSIESISDPKFTRKQPRQETGRIDSFYVLFEFRSRKM